MNTVYGASVRGFGEDKMCWKSDSDKGFMVMDYYNLLVGSMTIAFLGKAFGNRRFILE